MTMRDFNFWLSLSLSYSPDLSQQESPADAGVPARRKNDEIEMRLSMVLRLRQHNIGYTADGFYRSDDPTNSVKALKEGG